MIFVSFVQKKKYQLMLLILTLMFFWKVILLPSKVLFSPFSDLVTQDFFWKYLVHDTFQKFWELPLWNPYTFGGAPFLANHIPKIVYPPNLLFLVFPKTELLFSYLYIAHFFLAGLFLYLFAREIGLEEFSSFISAVIYIFNIRTVTLVYAGLSNELPLIAFFPAALYLFERLLKKRNFFYSILMGIFLSLIIFGVHTQYTVYLFLFLFAYLLFRVFTVYKKEKDKASIKRIFMFFACSVVISIMLSSVQLLPSIEILKYDTRSKGISYEFATVSSFPPYHLVTAAIPNFFGTLVNNNYWGMFPSWQFAVYIGILPLMLALLSLRKKNSFVVFFVAFLASSLVLSFGKYNPAYYYLYKFVPLFGSFRAPSRYLFFYIFSVSIMAGFGLNFLLNAEAKPERLFLKKALALLFALVVLSTIILACALVFRGPILNLGNKMLEAKYSKSYLELGLMPLNYYKEKIANSLLEIYKGILIFIMLVFCTAILLFLWLKKRIGMVYLKIFITIIVLADLWFFSMPFVDVKSTDIAYTQKNVPLFISRDKGYFRVLDLANALPQETAIRYNLRQAGGYEAMILRQYREYASEMAGIPFIPSTIIPIKEVKYKQMLNLLNVKYLISDKKLNDSDYEMVYNNTVFVYTNNEKKFYSDKEIKDSLFEFSNFQTDYVYKNKHFMPEAFVVGNPFVLERSLILDSLKSADFNPKGQVILEQDPGKKEAGSIFKEAFVSFYSPNRIKINVETEEPGFLVLSEIWYPGWVALDNGKYTKVYRADYMLRSVYLDKGQHEIEFVFKPMSFIIGLWITLASIIFVAVYFAKKFIFSTIDT